MTGGDAGLMPLLRTACLLLCVLALATVGCGAGDESRDTAAEGSPTPGATPARPEQPSPDPTPDGEAGALACPAPSPGEPAADRRLDARRLVGLPERRAEARAARYGCTIRAVRRDGRGLAGTTDLRRDRVNVVIREGVVARVVDVG